MNGLQDSFFGLDHGIREGLLIGSVNGLYSELNNNNVIKDGLILLYDFSNPDCAKRYNTQSISATIYDLSINKNNAGVNTSAINKYDTINGGVYNFNSTLDYINRGTTTYTLYNGATFDIWIKLHSINRTQGFFSHVGSPFTVSYFDFQMDSTNKLRWAYGFNDVFSTIFSTETIRSNKWYNFTGVISNTQNRLYVNGALQAMANVTYTVTSSVGPIFIGTGGGGGLFSNCSVGYFSFYNRPLNAGEVSQNYMANFKRFTQ